MHTTKHTCDFCGKVYKLEQVAIACQRKHQDLIDELYRCWSRCLIHVNDIKFEKAVPKEIPFSFSLCYMRAHPTLTWVDGKIVVVFVLKSIDFANLVLYDVRVRKTFDSEEAIKKALLSADPIFSCLEGELNQSFSRFEYSCTVGQVVQVEKKKNTTVWYYEVIKMLKRFRQMKKQQG